jgi:hypothetical protein
MGPISVWACFGPLWEMFGFCHDLSSCAGWVERNEINYLACLHLQDYSTPIEAALQELYGLSQGVSYLSNSFAYRAGTARFDPPNPFSIAKFTPITFPSRLNSGPPDPPEVVAAS